MVATAICLALGFAAATATVAPAAEAASSVRGLQSGEPADGLAGSPIDPSTVVQLSDPGVELTTPVDGRLRGDGVALVVTGAALTDYAGTGGDAVSAGSGNHLIVFGIRQLPQTSDAAAPPASLALVVAGQRRSIDLASLAGNGPSYFAAAIPTDTSSADLELSASGFSQDFALLTLTRVGMAPTALYRDPDNAEVVDTDSSTVAVPIAAGPPDSTTYSLQVGAQTTTISWFAPDASRDTPSSPNQAFLAVQLHPATLIDPANNDVIELMWPSPVPADDVQLVLADGTRLPATHVADTNQDTPGVSVNLFTGIYYFTVPADIAATTLSVAAYGARPGRRAASRRHDGHRVGLHRSAPPECSTTGPATGDHAAHGAEVHQREDERWVRRIRPIPRRRCRRRLACPLGRRRRRDVGRRAPPASTRRRTDGRPPTGLDDPTTADPPGTRHGGRSHIAGASERHSGRHLDASSAADPGAVSARRPNRSSLYGDGALGGSAAAPGPGSDRCLDAAPRGVVLRGARASPDNWLVG